jgi:hypothetical protein
VIASDRAIPFCEFPSHVALKLSQQEMTLSDQQLSEMDRMLLFRLLASGQGLHEWPLTLA